MSYKQKKSEWRDFSRTIWNLERMPSNPERNYFQLEILSKWKMSQVFKYYNKIKKLEEEMKSFAMRVGQELYLNNHYNIKYEHWCNVTGNLEKGLYACICASVCVCVHMHNHTCVGVSGMDIKYGWVYPYLPCQYKMSI